MDTPELHYVVNAKDAINIKFINNVSDITKTDNIYHPAFAHQLFGDTEQIYGYKGLNIDLYFISSTMQVYLGMRYDERVQDKHPECAPADDVTTVLLRYLPDKSKIFTDISTFSKVVEHANSSWRPFGEEVMQYNRDGDIYTVYRSTPSVQGFKTWLHNMRILVLLFVDASSYIDDDDDSWVMYCTFSHSSSGTSRYSLVSFATMYPFLMFPDKQRYRVSQMLVMPYIQRGGHGGALLRTIYDEALANDNIYDVTIEEPSDAFVTLRDTTDVKLCLSKGLFSVDLDPADGTFPPELEWSDELSSKSRALTKLYIPQIRRVYEICKLQYVTKHPSQALQESYRKEIKKRLFVSLQEDLLQLETEEERKAQLQQEFQQIVNDYREIARRVWS